MKYFIIPGNPPAKYFYENWISELVSLYPNSDFYTESFPTFSKELSADDYFEKIINHYRDLIINIKGEEPIHVIGHSIGGYIAYSILEKNPQLLKSCTLIFPFMGCAGTMAKFILKVSSNIHKTNLISNFILNNKNKLNIFFPEIKFITKKELKSGLRFASFEKNYFEKHSKLPFIRPELRSRVKLIYNQRDNWCSQKIINCLKNQIEAQFVFSKHDFIIHPEDRARVGKLLNLSAKL